VLDWLLANGIRSQLSSPYLHWQNGQIERDIQSVLNKARTMMAQYNVPPKLWSYAITCAAYILNRTHIAANKESTLFEMVYSEMPDVSHFVAFYAPGVFYLSRDERRDKF
jgi:hypothetical protein